MSIFWALCRWLVSMIPYQTGKFFVYPGPRMHNGLLFEDATEAETEKTKRLINRLCVEEPDYVDPRVDTLDYTGMTESRLSISRMEGNSLRMT